MAALEGMRPLRTSGAMRSASVRRGGAEASENMPRPTGSAIARRQSSSSRDCCSWSRSWSESSGEALSRSASGRDEQSSRRTSLRRRSAEKSSAEEVTTEPIPSRSAAAESPPPAPDDGSATG